ncbi:MAG: CPBP family intramembrane metalloprotease [Alicyclobacillaceae bacterium]|nr:CPBP family intramembrane metalloprotease [Alicyclobacillaceae bacterium]
MEQKGHRLLFEYLAGFFISIAGLVLMWVFHVPWSALLDVGNPWRVLGLGTVVALMNISLVGIMYKFLPRMFEDLDDENRALASYLSQLSHVHLFSLMALTAVAEEIFFRAVLQSLMIQWWSSVPLGIGVAAGIFTAFHVRYFKMPVLLASGFVVGLTVGWLFWYTGNIWAAAWSHFLYNVTLVLMSKKRLTTLGEKGEAAPSRAELAGEAMDVSRETVKWDWKNQWRRFIVGFAVGLVITAVLALMMGL